MRIEVSNNQTVYGLSKSERDKVKENLTFKNPAYLNAKKYSPYGYTSIPQFLEYFEESTYLEGGERKKKIEIPIGVDLEKLLKRKAEFEDQRISPFSNFPKFSLKLREDQTEAALAYLQFVKEKTIAPSLISMPTGKGKTITALYIASRLKTKTLILVHKNDLVVGWKKDIEKCFPGMKTGLIKAKSRKIGEHITIATVQTLARLTEEELAELYDTFGLVIQDECHHIGLNIFNIIGNFNSRYKLGLSATPVRNDGLNFVFRLFLGGLCYKFSDKKIAGESDKDISDVEVKTLVSPAKFIPCIDNDGEVFNAAGMKYIPEELLLVEDIPHDKRPKISYMDADDEAVMNPKTMKLVGANILEEYSKGNSVLALFTQKKHIEEYAAMLEPYLLKREHMILYYGDSKEDSEKLMQLAEDKKARITLATYSKASEGTNVRAWEVLFLVSSRNNEKDIEQATGRIRRRKHGKIDPVIVYDVKYPGCYMLRSHFRTHQRVYSRLGYKGDVDKSANQFFKRGYERG